MKRSVIAWLICGATTAVLLAASSFNPLYSQTKDEIEWMKTWIPATCCSSNSCCWEIQESELKPLPDDNYEVKSTGQVRKRTDWSPDGKHYRCACDYDAASRQWIKHQGANTRCLFIPMRGF